VDPDSLLVGRYELRRQIAAGGIAQVWLAHDTVLGRDVAVKVQELDPDLDRAAFARFMREARSAAGIQHPNVVSIFDSGIDQDTAFLVMELMPGPTLSGYLAEHGPLAEHEAVALAAQVAAGLSAAHSAGLVHRDIKPANLMFDAHGVLKIVDFGIVRLIQAETTQLTVMNGIIGSPGYLSPEGINGRPVDERSDIYSLGAVLMVMLTGRGPFDATDQLTLLHQHVHAPPPQIRHRRPDISPGLNTLVAQMLSKSPEDRPQSARAVLSSLTGSPPRPRSASATVAGAGGPSDLQSPIETLLATTEQLHQPLRPALLWAPVRRVNMLHRMQSLPVLATFVVLGVLVGVISSVPGLGRSTLEHLKLPVAAAATALASTTTTPSQTPERVAGAPSVTSGPSAMPKPAASPTPRTTPKALVKPKRQAEPKRIKGEKTTKPGSTTEPEKAKKPPQKKPQKTTKPSKSNKGQA
jgi:eukaryotic-like serine/threonine-protein kinase